MVVNFFLSIIKKLRGKKGTGERKLGGEKK